MTVFESKALISKPISDVFTFLSDLSNHRRLMPSNITDWSANRDEARFTIQNMGELALKITERLENTTILIVPAAKAPIEMEMQWNLTENENNTTLATLTISAELNMMMKMLASGPLQKLADYQTEQLSKI